MAGAVLVTVQQQQNSSNINGHIQNQLTRSLEKILDEANQSGELKLSNRKLKDFPKTSSSDKYNLSDTVIADLSKNRFSELPEEVTTFHFLERLQCYHNTIRYIPDAIVNLQCLIYLDLSRNQLTSLPRELCQLPIKILLVSNNNLAYLPDELSRMSQLTELDASCNQLTHLPPRMGDLKSLQSLVLRQNLLLAVPLELTYLKLARLDLRANRIGSLPIELRDMHTLIDLLVEDNPLTSPPASLCRRGRVHIFKYLENEAIKLDRRMGGGNGGTLSRRSRKAGNGNGNGSNNSSPGPTPLLTDRLKHKRQNVDSGYSTSSDGFEKRWSQEITTGDNEKNNWTSTPNSSLRSDTTNGGGVIIGNGILSNTPSSSASPAPPSGETPADEDLDRMDGGSPRDYNNSSYRLSPCIDSSGLTNGNEADDKTKPLHQIQTYREYKEALKQQRAQDVPSIYRTKDHELNASSSQNIHTKTEPNTPTHHHHYHHHNQHSNNSSNNNSHNNYQHTSLATSKSDPTPLNAVLSGSNGKYGLVFDSNNDSPPSPKKIERTSPFRNISGYSPSHATYNGTSTATADNTSSSTGNKSNHVLSSSPKYIHHQHQDYVKPQSPVKGKTGIMSHDNVPVCSTVNGSVAVVGGGKLSSSPRSATIATGATANDVTGRNGIIALGAKQASSTGRSISWNKDVSSGGSGGQHPPTVDKMTFTMRREIDKAKEENELINQLRNIIESRLKMTLPEDLAPALTDGVVLCHLANHIKPRSVASIHVPSPAVPKLTMARCRRNVDNFIEACRRIGVDEGRLCSTLDVTESLLAGGRGLPRLLDTLVALCGLEFKLQRPSPPPPPPPPPKSGTAGVTVIGAKPQQNGGDQQQPEWISTTTTTTTTSSATTSSRALVETSRPPARSGSGGRLQDTTVSLLLLAVFFCTVGLLIAFPPPD